MTKLPYKILIVEDEVTVLELLKDCFADSYQTIAVSSIKEAQEQLKKTRPDLVILDRGLPDGDGLELCAEIRENPQYQSLPVLMLTGKGEAGDKVLGLNLGADDYLAKPFELAELKVRVEALFRRTDDLNLRRPIKRSLRKD
ncbi:MAG: response regulator transcription factor [Elusimicrobiota bacterium]|nr:response regulator transcription factor [Elusimicrobiota bacterium]